MSSGIAGPAYFLDRIALSSPQQRWLRGLALGGALGFMVLLWLHGGHHPLLTLVGVALAAQTAALPESNGPLLLVLYLSGLWIFTTGGAVDGWTLLATLLLLALHLGCTLASHGPPGLDLDRRLLAAWWPRALLCVAAALGVWGIARAVTLLDAGASRLAVAAALVLVLGWCVVVTLRVAWTHDADPDDV